MFLAIVILSHRLEINGKRWIGYDQIGHNCLASRSIGGDWLAGEIAFQECGGCIGVEIRDLRIEFVGKVGCDPVFYAAGGQWSDRFPVPGK